MTERVLEEDRYLRVCPVHDLVNKDKSTCVIQLPFRFCFFSREKVWPRENWRGVDISGLFKREKVRCRLAYSSLELLLWPEKGLYETILVGSTSDDVLDRADKVTNPFHNLHHWLGGRRIRETRDIFINLLQ